MNDDGTYYSQQRQLIKALLRRAVSGGNDTVSRDLRQMMGLERKGDRDGDKAHQPRKEKDAPRT